MNKEYPVDLFSQIQQDLKNSELKYRRLFESAKDGILILDLDTGRISDVNPFLCELLGFTFAEMVGKTVGEISPFKDTVVNQAMLERLQDTGYVRYKNLPLETKTGRRIAVEFVCNVYQVGSEQVIQCNIRDITERNEADQKLALLGACVQNLNDIVLVTEAQPLNEPGPRIVMVNRAFERITGYTAAEAIGRSPRFLQGPKSCGPALADIYKAMAEHRHIRRQFVNYAKDGREYCLDVDIVPIFDAEGKCTHFAATERDITENVKAEARIAEQASFLDKARDAILVRDLTGVVLYWNQGAERIYGWTHAEAIGQRSDVLLSVDPLKFQELNKITLAAGEWNGQVQQTGKDRRAITVEARCTLIRDGEGNPKSVLEIGTDITDRKNVEAQLMRAQRMESIGTLAGGIAHDLNNILAPIMMSIGMLIEESKNPETTEILKTLESSAKRGADIVRQVLSFARGVEGERIEVQSKHLLKDLEGIIKDTFPKDIHLEFAIADPIWTIVADPTQVHQILLNLCVNSRDAMPFGGYLRISAKNCVLDEQYVATNLGAKVGRYVCLSVTDTGTGILPGIKDRIFEPFFTTKDISKGTGLGLSTVMAIVKSHGGSVNVYSEPGRGTTFSVYLPACACQSAALEAVAVENVLPGGNGETILVVDDEPAILGITCRTLEKFGYKVLTATDGADAVAIYAEHKSEVAVVVADMMMPVMDGTAMIKALCRISPGIRIITVSGLGRSDGTAHAPGGAVKQSLLKPFTAETLLKALREVLEEAAEVRRPGDLTYLARGSHKKAGGH
jgi:PAS domain S-box-containing protein